MVTQFLHQYTIVYLADERSHLVDPYGRYTLCGQNKRHAQTIWPTQAAGTGCHICQIEAVTRLTKEFAKRVKEFDEFVQGRLVEVA